MKVLQLNPVSIAGPLSSVRLITVHVKQLQLLAAFVDGLVALCMCFEARRKLFEPVGDIRRPHGRMEYLVEVTEHATNVRYFVHEVG